MADLLREIDEAVRADTMRRIWNEHGIALVVGVAALILGTAAYAMWTSWELAQNRAATATIMTAADSFRPAAALADAPDLKGNAKAIALINAGALNIKAGDLKIALANYTAAAGEKTADETFRHLALLQKINLTLDLVPDAAANGLLGELKPVVDSQTSAFSGEGLFLSAYVTAEKNRDYARAAELLKKLEARADVTESLKQRAGALRSVYEMKSKSKK